LRSGGGSSSRVGWDRSWNQGWDQQQHWQQQQQQDWNAAGLGPAAALAAGDQVGTHEKI